MKIKPMSGASISTSAWLTANGENGRTFGFHKAVVMGPTDKRSAIFEKDRITTGIEHDEGRTHPDQRTKS